MKYNSKSLAFCNSNTSLIFEGCPNSLAKNLSEPCTLTWTFLDDLISKKERAFSNNSAA